MHTAQSTWKNSSYFVLTLLTNEDFAIGQIFGKLVTGKVIMIRLVKVSNPFMTLRDYIKLLVLFEHCKEC